MQTMKNNISTHRMPLIGRVSIICHVKVIFIERNNGDRSMITPGCVLEFYGPVKNEVMLSRSVNSGTVPGQAYTF